MIRLAYKRAFSNTFPMKKLILSFLISLFLFAQTTFGFYSDVPQDHKYYNAIKTLYDADLLAESDKFEPDKKLTTLDFYELVLNYKWYDLPTKIDLPFTNTDNKALYAPYLQAALDLELIAYPSEKEAVFNFNKKMNKHQTISKIFKIVGVGVSYAFDREIVPLKDVKKSSDTAAIAFKAWQMGIVEEKYPDYYRRGKIITKGEATDYLYKIYKYNPYTSQSLIPSVKISQDTYTETEKELINNTNFSKLIDIWSIIKSDYLYKDDLNNDSLIQGAIKGLIETLDDPYTTYQKPIEAEKFFSQLSNEYEGVGMSLDLIGENITIVSPFNGSPAEKAGLKSGDIIIAIDGENMTEKTLEYAISKIKGPAATKVKIKIKRASEELEFTVERAKILYDSIQSEIKETSGKKIGYIAINVFGNETYTSFIKAAKDLLEKKPDGFIIDLRNNPGGYLSSAIDLVGLFSKDKIVAVKLQDPDKTLEFITNGNGLLAEQKIIILINEGSASASEILAGALKEYEFATLIGTKSFGKGTVQDISDWQDGSLFKYTSAKWLTPNGKNIHGTGFTPDKIVLKTAGKDEPLEAALKEF